MVMNIDPKEMAKVQQVSNKINAEIKVIYPTHEIHIKLTPTTKESTAFVERFVPQFAEMTATQLSTFFGIRGDIVDVGKAK
jgi:hypothetical protein